MKSLLLRFLPRDTSGANGESNTALIAGRHLGRHHRGGERARWPNSPTRFRRWTANWRTPDSKPPACERTRDPRAAMARGLFFAGCRGKARARRIIARIFRGVAGAVRPRARLGEAVISLRPHLQVARSDGDARVADLAGRSARRPGNQAAIRAYCPHGRTLKKNPKKKPVMLPFQDKTGPGWHVVIRYHHGGERLGGWIRESKKRGFGVDWLPTRSKSRSRRRQAAKTGANGLLTPPPGRSAAAGITAQAPTRLEYFDGAKSTVCQERHKPMRS